MNNGEGAGYPPPLSEPPHGEKLTARAKFRGEGERGYTAESYGGGTFRRRRLILSHYSTKERRRPSQPASQDMGEGGKQRETVQSCV